MPRHLCDTCQCNPLYTIDHTTPKIILTCTVCGGNIKFQRVLHITNYVISRKKIWAITQNLELIQSMKNKVAVKDKMWPLQRDIAYHNLYVNIVKYFQNGT